MGLIEDKLDSKAASLPGEKSKLDHIEEDHGKRLARIESKQDGLEGHFKKVLDGQRKMLEILERLGTCPPTRPGGPDDWGRLRQRRTAQAPRV